MLVFPLLDTILDERRHLHVNIGMAPVFANVNILVVFACDDDIRPVFLRSDDSAVIL